MDQSCLTAIVLLCFLSSAKAQQATNQNQNQNQNQHEDVNPLHPSMAVVLTVLAIMFSITFLIVAYAKFCQAVQPLPNEVVQDPGGIVRSRSRFSGIDRKVIESLPFFRFSSLKGSKEGLECAVCLSRFEDTEILRLLPKCRHAFHVACIDKWLESHSSCPLCRYKLDAVDIKSSNYTNSFRNQDQNQNLEFFIQREQSQRRSARFNISNVLTRANTNTNREEPLIQELKKHREESILHNFRHKIIVSDVIHKSRWSDVNSSDMMSLNTEMLSVLSRKEFSSKSGEVSRDQMMKIKEDMERKRLHESKTLTTNGNVSGETSGCCDDGDLDTSMTVGKSFDPAEKRSMSEITNVSRFTEFMNTSRRISDQVKMEKDERVRRLWLTIARRTIQLFSGRETSLDASKNMNNV